MQSDGPLPHVPHEPILHQASLVRLDSMIPLPAEGSVASR